MELKMEQMQDQTFFVLGISVYRGVRRSGRKFECVSVELDVDGDKTRLKLSPDSPRPEPGDLVKVSLQSYPDGTKYRALSATVEVVDRRDEA